MTDLKRDMGPSFNDYEFYLLYPGAEPSVDDEVTAWRNGGWRLGGLTGRRHWVRKKKGNGMTKQEAMLKIAHAVRITVGLGQIDPMRRKEIENFVVCLEALGLIKFDEPKSEDDLLTEALHAAWRAAGQKNATHGPLAINKALLDAGFEIRRRA